MFCLRSKFHINELIRFLQRKIIGYFSFTTVTSVVSHQLFFLQSARRGPFNIVTPCLIYLGSIAFLMSCFSTGDTTVFLWLLSNFHKGDGVEFAFFYARDVYPPY